MSSVSSMYLVPLTCDTFAATEIRQLHVEQNRNQVPVNTASRQQDAIEIHSHFPTVMSLPTLKVMDGSRVKSELRDFLAVILLHTLRLSGFEMFHDFRSIFINGNAPYLSSTSSKPRGDDRIGTA